MCAYTYILIVRTLITFWGTRAGVHSVKGFKWKQWKVSYFQILDTGIQQKTLGWVLFSHQHVSHTAILNHTFSNDVFLNILGQDKSQLLPTAYRILLTCLGGHSAFTLDSLPVSLLFPPLSHLELDTQCSQSMLDVFH